MTGQGAHLYGSGVAGRVMCAAAMLALSDPAKLFDAYRGTINLKGPPNEDEGPYLLYRGVR